jgi:hypothetical protein
MSAAGRQYLSAQCFGDLLQRLLKEHGTDDNRDRLIKSVVEHLELSGFEIDEQA